MGGGPSKEEVEADMEFSLKIQNQQRDILASNMQDIQNFFESVDSLVINQGSMSYAEAQDKEKVSDTEKKKVEDITQKAKEAGVAPPPAGAPDVSKEGQVVHKPANSSVIVLLNQASVIYKNSVSSKPEVLNQLVDTVKETINDVLALGASGGASSGDYEKKGAQVPGPLVNSVKLFFAKPAAILSVSSGILSVAKVLLTCLESNASVSSSVLKKIQFVSPGLYCATYYSTSVFHMEIKSFSGTRKIDYSLSCGGMYLITSPKLIQIVQSVIMYQEISESFSKRLKESEAQIDQLVAALGDSAYFGTKFGFNDNDYQVLMKQLKTLIMQDIVRNFWENTRDYNNKERTAIWNDYVKTSDMGTRIASIRLAYEAAYKDLQNYYNDFVLRPPIDQH